MIFSTTIGIKCLFLLQIEFYINKSDNKLRKLGNSSNNEEIVVICWIASSSLCFFVFSSRAEEEEKEEKDDIGTVIGIDLGTTYSW